MTTNHHDPIVTGESNAAATWNTRYASLDAAITSEIAAVETVLNNLIIASGTSDAETIAARTAGNNDGSTPVVLSDAIEFAAANIYNVLAYGAEGDGVTNDTTAIAAALTAAGGAGGGVVVLPPGDYLVSTLTVPANVVIEGQGLNSVFEITSTNSNAITLDDNCRLRNLKVFCDLQSTSHRALIYVDGDNVNIDNVTVEATFVADSSTDNLVSGIRLNTDGANFTLSNCHLIGPSISAPFYDGTGRAGWGVIVHGDNCTGKMSNITSEGWNDGIKITSEGGDMTIVNCHLKNNNRDGLDTYYSGGGHIVCSNSIFTNNQDLIADFKTVGDDEDDGLSYALIFANNICYDHTNVAGTGAVTYSTNQRVLIANNQFINQLRGISANSASGGTNTASGGVIIGNRFESIKFYGIQAIGVASSDSDTPLLITGNVIVDPGTGEASTDTATGIRLADITNVIVSNNMIYWTVAGGVDHSNVSAIRLASGTANCVITGNYSNRIGTMISNADATWLNNFIWANTDIASTITAGGFRYNATTNHMQVYNGSSWGSLPYLDISSTYTAAALFTGGLRTGTATALADDAVATITASPTTGILLISCVSGSDEAAVIHFRCATASHCTLLVGGGGVAVSTSVLTGMTGSDGFITVSAVNPSTIYIENRQGGARNIVYTIIG